MKASNIKEEFNTIYIKESDSLFRYCLTRVSDREKAIDIVQDVFTQLWIMYNKGEVVKYSRAFLFTVARNRIIDWYRKKKSLSLDAMADTDSELFFEPMDEKAHLNIILSTEAKRVIEAIDTLEPSYREAVYLRFVEDLSPQEIATILETTAGVVSVRITRGIEKLKAQFNK
jgi:RNA polymerase sigma-70 factor (ECF subfamily)